MQAREYASRGLTSVEGWLTKTAATTIADLSGVQTQLGIQGGACEIGVHHGRLFILLCLLLRDGERAMAIDLFDLQDENVDASGCGNREQFLTNIARFGIKESRVDVLAENSLRLTAERVRASVGAPRLFSVDGGHTAEITYSDLAVATASTCDGALIILDDFMHPQWMGVTEGAFAFVREHRELFPVAFISNKMIFARGDAAPYLRAVNGETVQLFGSPCVIDSGRTSLRSRLVDTNLWRLMRSTGVGRFIRRAAR